MAPRVAMAIRAAKGIGTAMAISEAMAIRAAMGIGAVAPREPMKPSAAAISRLGARVAVVRGSAYSS
jgi:hypothetical protein